MSHITLGIDDVQVIDSLYPRLRPIEMKIQEYQDNVEAAPRITVARGCVLVDGYHRWQAHKRNGATTVEAIDLGDMTDEEILVESSRLNSRHGTSLTMDEKRRLALVLAKPYGSLTQGDTAKVLSVSLRTVEAWLAKADAEARAARRAEEEANRKRDIAEAERLRAEGMTQRAIAEALGRSQQWVDKWLPRPATVRTVVIDKCDTEQSTTVDVDPADATTPTPVAEPEPQPEPLDDETRQYLEQWSEDGDLVAEVESGRMTVAEATKHAKTAQRLYEHSEKHSPFKAHGEANQALKAACDLMTNFLAVSAVALEADDPQLWRRLRILAPQTIERSTQWKEAADVKVD